MKKRIATLLLGLFIASVSVSAYAYNLTPRESAALVESSDWILKQAFLHKKSGIQVHGQGVVIRLLSDDVVADRHQRFILRLNSGQTLLIAHNIDIAPRLVGFKKGGTVIFYGQYEWNREGGVVHWTHHDPGREHINGWLKYENSTYR
jgi:hypothetical protein